MEIRAQQKQIRPGYKQTEVGVIPEDWASSKLGDFAFVTKLAGFEYTIHFDYSKSGPIIAIRALNIKDGALDLTEVHTIPQRTSDLLPRSKLTKGDLVISYVGTLGRVAVIPESNRFHLAPNVAKMSVDKANVSPQFLAHFLNSFQGQRIILEAAASTTQAALSMRNLREVVFSRPPLFEQRNIAQVLDDMDELIGRHDKLIAKKHNLKQAAMQQLLTGKQRLPGFRGEWASSDFDQTLRKIGTKLNQIQTHEYASHGSYPVIDQGQSSIAAYSDEDRKLFICPEGGVIVFGDHTRIVKFVEFNFIVGADGTQVLGVQDGCTAKFMYYQLLLKEIPNTGYNRHFKFLKAMRFSVPPYEEQTAIAAVLSDMDADIAALEGRRDKIRDLKQAMMQQLLTGNIRLV